MNKKIGIAWYLLAVVVVILICCRYTYDNGYKHGIFVGRLEIKAEEYAWFTYKEVMEKSKNNAIKGRHEK